MNLPDFNQLEEKLNLAFKNKDLLTQAFCHKSFVNEHPNLGFTHNERLEFLGDAVLELIVTEYLYNHFKDKPEGELTALRSALVKAQTLAKVAERLGFNGFLLLSKGESKAQGKARRYILANTFEALIGALYLDQGFRKAKKFVLENLIKPELPVILEQKLFLDFKSKFQEVAQEKVGITPTYQVLKEWGPDHAKNFRVAVYLGKEKIAEGEGTSKQEAEEKAAQKALEVKGWNDF